jgi:murein DD-endopeptidase MepM/ murein hydrolase activator NlpD
MQAKRGEKVKATADGIVIQASNNGDYGHFVEINHGNGFTTSFSHLQEYKVKKGDKVKRGQVIGLVGNTGRSTGVHLHYELCQNGNPINPVTFMQTADLSKKIAIEEIKAGASKKMITVASVAKKDPEQPLTRISAVAVKIKKQI